MDRVWACVRAPVALGPRRQVDDRVAGPHSRRGRARQRVPLPRPHRLEEPAGGRHLAVGRDARTRSAAMREAKKRGATTMTLCNVVGSAMTREADFTVLTNAGPEIGVASTKGLHHAARRPLPPRHQARPDARHADREQAQQHPTLLSEVPKVIEQVLQTETKGEGDRAKYLHATDFLFLGRGPMHAVALEGALKLRRSRTSTPRATRGRDEARPHRADRREAPRGGRGPCRSRTCTTRRSSGTSKSARGGQVIAVVEQGDEHAKSLANDFIEIPKTSAPRCAAGGDDSAAALSYHVADLRGTDADQPRNLAKSVTVRKMSEDSSPAGERVGVRGKLLASALRRFSPASQPLSPEEERSKADFGRWCATPGAWPPVERDQNLRACPEGAARALPTAQAAPDAETWLVDQPKSTPSCTAAGTPTR